MRSKESAYQTCRSHHYWTHLRAWVTGRQYFHACNVTWPAVSISIRSDVEAFVDGIERLRKRLSR